MRIPSRGHHVSFAVRDLDASLAFYRDALGLEPIERPDFGFPGAWLEAPGLQVHLIQAPDGVDVGTPPAALSPVADHFAFQIDDYETARDALRAQGIEVLETSPEVGQMWVADPDGHVIELIVPGGRLGRVPRQQE
jgi:glyoxylase I family protein